MSVERADYLLNLRIVDVSLRYVPVLQRFTLGAMATVLVLGAEKLTEAYASGRIKFIGWIYILVRKPYRVGDRIRIDDSTGDVIDVGYLDRTLWEFGGEYLSTDHPSGRLIKFPNAKVLSTSIYNYSWPLFPYVWNEIKFVVEPRRAGRVKNNLIRTMLDRLNAEPDLVKFPKSNLR